MKKKIQRAEITEEFKDPNDRVMKLITSDVLEVNLLLFSWNVKKTCFTVNYILRLYLFLLVTEKFLMALNNHRMHIIFSKVLEITHPKYIKIYKILKHSWKQRCRRAPCVFGTCQLWQPPLVAMEEPVLVYWQSWHHLIGVRFWLAQVTFFILKTWTVQRSNCVSNIPVKSI